MRLPTDEVAQQFSVLASDGFCADAYARSRELLSLLLPPERISTTECAAKYRYIKNPEGDGKRLWSLNRTPYMTGPQDAMDSPLYRMVVVVGPERSGKSVGAENYLFRCLRNGPLTDVIIYLQAGVDCDSYADKEFASFIELHPEIQNKLGTRPTDRKRRHKKFSGRSVQILPANDGNLRQKEAPLIIATEIDGYKKTAPKAVMEIRGRQKSFGNQAKAYVESHPDLGWEIGIAPAWKDGTRGIPYWQCTECGGWSTPHQLAPKGMRSVMHYTRDDALDDYHRIATAESTAVLLCPHHGCMIDDASRYKMIDGIVWVHEGQSIDSEGVVTGEMLPNETASFWLHGLNVKRPLAPMAREHLAASIHFERTRKPDLIKRFTVKSLGEVYEGAGTGSHVLDPVRLKERADLQEMRVRFPRGMAPDWALFVVAAVDVGGRKFDAGWWGFDLEGRSALIDRVTINDIILPNGQRRDIRPPENIADWMQLRERVIERVFPLAGNPTMGLPVAVCMIDTGGSGTRDKNEVPDGVTYKAREFARRMARAGIHWGPSRFQKVKLIKGISSTKDLEILSTREINVDENNHPVSPIVREFNLNVDKLKALSASRLQVDDGGPGHCYFADDLPRSVFEELCAEKMLDGKWERHGANEAFDLFGYCEAGRIILDPDRTDIKWNIRRPVWARPVKVVFDTPAPGRAAQETEKPKSFFERFDGALNSSTDQEDE